MVISKVYPMRMSGSLHYRHLWRLLGVSVTEKRTTAAPVKSILKAVELGMVLLRMTVVLLGALTANYAKEACNSGCVTFWWPNLTHTGLDLHSC